MLAFLFFFFNDTATTEIYTLSLHDALPISRLPRVWQLRLWHPASHLGPREGRILAGFRLDFRRLAGDRKSTRLNSSHANISYAVFCLKKKKKHEQLVYQYYKAGNFYCYCI